VKARARRGFAPRGVTIRPIDASRRRVDAHRDARRPRARSRSSRALSCDRSTASRGRDARREGAKRVANARARRTARATLDENRRRDRDRASTRDGRARRTRRGLLKRVFSRRSRAGASATGRASAIVGAEEAIARIAAVRLGDVLAPREARGDANAASHAVVERGGRGGARIGEA